MAKPALGLSTSRRYQQQQQLQRSCAPVLLALVLLYGVLLFVLELPLVYMRLAPPALRRPLHIKLIKPLETIASDNLAVHLRRRSLSVSSLSLHHLNHSSYYASSISITSTNNQTVQPAPDVRIMAARAWKAGQKLMKEIEEASLATSATPPANKSNGSSSTGGEEQFDCPQTISLSNDKLDIINKQNKGVLLELPCGLMAGSHITLVAVPRKAHPENDPSIFPLAGQMVKEAGSDPVMVSQFVLELQGLKTVDGEEPPKILHFNPRLKGDWSGEAVIEQNSCYRMQWGNALRCVGWASSPDEERVDGQVKCEKWISEEDLKTIQWLNKLDGKKREIPLEWPYPFNMGQMFVLTLSAGFEGYHIVVNGRHVTSFPYRVGFDLEDATGFSISGDLDVNSVVAASMPTSHPSFSPQRHLEMSSLWQAPDLPQGPIDLFIGILSSGNHFAERMAARKSWMSSIRNAHNVVARFFVAMHGRKEINMELKKEAEFFRDIIIVPFLDSYDLVVLKTLAICDYGLRTVSAKYVMKCDDDTFVRVDSVMDEVRLNANGSLYIGNMNYNTKPLRKGKWAVTPEEWPEEEYPPYANGPGYVISSDIANFIVSEFEKHRLKLFKMEDVSLGMWVKQFNESTPVNYVHNLKFCQYGCVDGYITAHYQSPKQMMCMWEKLQMSRAECCGIKQG